MWVRTTTHVLNPHGKGVDVLVELVHQRNGLDDHVVRPIHVELDLSPGVRVTQAQLRLLHGDRGQAPDEVR